MQSLFRILLLSLALCLLSVNADAAKRKKQPADTVGLHCRGVMETFAKVSEGIEQRLEFYASEGMTHYFYCPTDDKYCNRWGWKFLYNDSDRHAVRDLNTLCAKKGLDFVWTVNPGSRYQWNADDYKFLLDKLVIMYYNGIRSFAVSFAENVGDHQAVRDSLMKDFVATRPEEVSLFMINDIPAAEYPAEGYTAAESLMKGYHFDEDFISRAKAANAMICNVSSLDEFAKLAVIAVADCAKGPKNYSADESMADAIKTLHGDIRDAFITFLRHTGKVDESSGVQTFKLDEWTAEMSDSLYREFDRIEKVPGKIRSCSGTEIIDALDPWLVQFGRLGTRGKNVLRCMDYYKRGELREFWLTYVSSIITDDELREYGLHPVGEYKLHPFCIEAMEALKEGFAAMLTGKTVLHNLASTLYAAPNPALDSDFGTSIPSNGHIEFAIPAEANTCHLLTGNLPEGKTIIFRQLRTDGSLVAEFVLKSPYSTFDIKQGAVKVDILGDVQVYENIFVYL